MISSKALSILGAAAVLSILLFTQLDHSERNTTIAQQASEEAESVGNANEASEDGEKMIGILSAGEADIVMYSTLEQVEQDADLIVAAELVGERTTENVVANSRVIETYSLAKVKVNHVYKGDVQEGAELAVAEPGYFDRSGNYVSFEGYKLMNKDGKYILFLRTGKNDKQIVLGLYQGKFDLALPQLEQELTAAKMSIAEFEQKDYVGDSVWQFNRLKKQVLEKYGAVE